MKKTYQFPNEPEVLLCRFQSKQWKAQGLTISIIEPFRIIRIIYNGFLKSTFENKQNVEYVKFNFLWSAAEKPIYYPQDIPTSLLSAALAKESWRNKDWIKLMGDEKGYEQFGALQGFISGEAYGEDLVLYLPSFRKRYWGTGENLVVRQNISLFIVSEDGTLISCGVKSFKEGGLQLQYGTVLSNTLFVFPIIRHDIDLDHIQENSIPTEFTTNIKTNKKTYKCYINLKNQTTAISNQINGWELTTRMGKCRVNNDNGLVLAQFWRPKQGKGVELPAPILKAPKVDKLKNKLIATFLEDECKSSELCGGKGSSLALLTSLKSNNFCVPEGFVILVPAFDLHLKQNNKLRATLTNLQRVLGDETEDLAATCEKTVDLFSSEAIPEEVAIDVRKQLEIIRKQFKSSEAVKWAVRSSGISEDSEELSAAGQNETVLGCSTDEDVLRAISLCWGSLFSLQSVEYRRQNGLKVKTSMGVVVQRMVPSDTSGVLFTCHPTTGDCSKMVITSNYGLGESVVSGRAEPDTIILSKSWQGHIGILSQEIGLKQTLIKMPESGNDHKTETFKVDGDKSKILSLTESQILLLGKVGVALEKAFDSVRDIEWSFYMGTLYLLQSRPVTTFNAWTDFELLHEFDVPTMTDREVFTLANVGEVMPGAITPLSNTIVNDNLDRIIYSHVQKTSTPFIKKFFTTTHHHTILNVINNLLRRVDKKITISQKVVDTAFCGHPVIDERLHEIALARFGAFSWRSKVVTFLEEILLTLSLNKITHKAVMLGSYFKINFDTCSSALEMFGVVKNKFDSFVDLCRCHARTSHISVFTQIVALNILAHGCEELTTDHYYDISLLLSCSNVVSAEIPKTLEKISKILRDAGVVEKFVKINPQNGVDWLRLNCLRASQEIESFLETHGHRGFREFEMRDETWGTNPGALIKMLQANCKKGSAGKPAEYRSVDETALKLITPQNETVRKILKYFMSKCRTTVAAREQTKSELVRAVNEFRIAFRKLAKQMTLEGIIPNADLIFFFTIYELQRVLKNQDSNLIQKAKRRQRLYPQWDSLKFPELMYGIPSPEKEIILSDYNDNTIKLKGTPVYPGDIKGRACVITDLKNIDQLEKGDILITFSTDIGWSPYFPMISGIVTELGGLISHGAVIAREYGLPCIVGCRSATILFKTGDLIYLSGKSGTIELIENRH